jgi:hypothetical protein
VSFKVRNSIALGVLFFLVIVIGGYVSFFYQPGKIKNYQKDAKKIATQLQDNTEQMNAIATMQNKLRETVHRWNNRTKEIPEFDISSNTYVYLSDIISESGNMRLNMSFGGTKASGQYGYNTYKLVGTSEFPNIFRFLWLLENGRRLYKLTSLSLRANEQEKSASGEPAIIISYDVELHSYFTSEKTLGTPVAKPDSTPQPITSNPFFPTITRQVPANTRNLLEVGKINVKAVSAKKALVMDGGGKLYTLNLGDEVYLGRLSAINPLEGIVEFTLNSGGIVEVVKKKIIFEKQFPGPLK